MTDTLRAIHLVRVAIGLPEEGKPNRSTILDMMNLHVNTIWGERRLTRDKEAFKILVQQIDPGQQDYAISADDFGKAFHVESWDDGADPYYIPVPMTIAPIQERDRQAIGVPFGQPASTFAEPVFSFFTEDGRRKLRVTPALSSANSYRVYYEVESYVLAYGALPLPLKDSFIHLLIVRTALSVLPFTDWDETRYQRFLTALQMQEQIVEPLFQDQKYMQQTDANARGSFGEERDGADLGFY